MAAIQINSPSGMAGAGASNSINSGANYTNSSIESQFRQAMQAVGIHYSGEIIADGQLHRFHIEGHKQSRRNGAYKLHLDGCPAGYFEDWKTGIKQTWKYYGGSVTSYESEQLIQTKKLARLRQSNARNTQQPLRGHDISGIDPNLLPSNQITPT